MELVAGYGSGGDDHSEKLNLKSLKVNLAPLVVDELKVPKVVDHTKRQILTNPTYKELWRPEQGPQAPWASNCSIVPGQQNTLTGFVEDAGVNDWAFDLQYNLFSAQGCALDPSSNVMVYRQKEKKKEKIVGLPSYCHYPCC